jgi:hypothetical protein
MDNLGGKVVDKLVEFRAYEVGNELSRGYTRHFHRVVNNL